MTPRPGELPDGITDIDMHIPAAQPMDAENTLAVITALRHDVIAPIYACVTAAERRIVAYSKNQRIPPSFFTLLTCERMAHRLETQLETLRRQIIKESEGDDGGEDDRPDTV